MKRILFILFALLCASFHLKSQTVEQLTELNNTNLISTARSSAVVNAFTALGADFASAHINPAGIAMFKRPELSISPNFTLNQNKSVYLDNKLTNNATNFSLSQIGIVFTPNMNRIRMIDLERHTRENRKNNTNKPFEPEKRKFGMNFAVSFAQLNNFDNVQNYRAFNRDHSITDRFTERLNAGAPYADYEFLAGETNIIRPDTVNNRWVTTLQYTDYFGSEDVGVEQAETITSTGRFNTINLSLAANFNDKFYLGLTVGVPYIDGFRRVNFYSEEDTEEKIIDFRYFDIEDVTLLNSSGINSTFGFATKLGENFRLGASYKTKTNNIIDYYYNSSIYSDVEGLGFGEYLQAFSDSYINLELYSPDRINVGLAYLYEKGFFSLDAEYVDYSKSEVKFNTNPSGFILTQEEIDFILSTEADYNTRLANNYNQVLNLKFGLERVLNDFRLRAGVAYHPSLYKNDENEAVLKYGAGFGWRLKQFYIDLTGNYFTTYNRYQPYSLSTIDVSEVEFNRGNINLLTTIGFKF